MADELKSTFSLGKEAKHLCELFFYIRLMGTMDSHITYTLDLFMYQFLNFAFDMLPMDQFILLQIKKT